MAEDVANFPSLIIYGGSFDPPHQGHVDCLSQILVYFPQAKVVITPSLQPAGAGGSHKHPHASYQQRMEMCKLAFEDVKWQARVSISSIEESLPTPNFSLATLEVMQRQNPDARLALLMGQDQLITFPQWRNPLSILDLADLIVMRRDSTELGYRGQLSHNTKEIATQLGVKLKWDSSHTRAEVDGKKHSIHLVNEQISLAESGLIRGFLLSSHPLPDGWLPAPVATYINENALYA